MLDEQGLIAGKDRDFFSLHHYAQSGSGSHPASYSVGTKGSFPGVKQPGCEADHITSSNAKVKNE
jgi:hypothetical protein